MNERGADDASTGTAARPAPLGVVLAGGASSRMGTDKALIRWGGVSLAEHALRRLARVCPDVVVADRGRGVVAGARSIEDGPGRGPVAALLGATRAAPGRALLALACDLPAVPEPFLAELARRGERSGADWVLARTARGIEPLAALYGPRALAALEEQVQEGRYAPRELLTRDDLRIEIIEGPDLARHGDPEHLFANLNHPEDLSVLEQSDP